MGFECDLAGIGDCPGYELVALAVAELVGVTGILHIVVGRLATEVWFSKGFVTWSRAGIKKVGERQWLNKWVY